MNLPLPSAPWANSVAPGHSFAYLFERFPSFVQTFCYREAAAMVRQGMQPLILSIRHPEDAAAVAAEFSDPVQYLPEEKALRAEVDRWNTEKKLPGRVRRAIREHRAQPDSQRMFEAVWLAGVLRAAGIGHVHAHFGGMAARTAWWLRKLYGITYSFTGHANDIFCENDFPVTNTDLAENAEFVVTETDYARLWMEQKYSMGVKGQVFRVFNGLDTTRFPAPTPYPPADEGERYDVLSVGRYVEKKGFGDLIDACRLMRAEGVHFTCGIVGEGPLRESLYRRIADAGLNDQVRLLGPKPQADVQALLRRAKVFALACVPDSEGGSDNLPTVVMEAMLCGTPVVSTNLAGVPEMINNHRDGLLVEPKDALALADALRKVLENPEPAGRMRDAAYQSALKKFSVDNSAHELKHLLVRYGCVFPPPEACAKDPTLPKKGIPWWKRIFVN